MSKEASMSELTKLTRKLSELEAARKDLEFFSHMVAHDLYQPLTVINGYCQGLKLKLRQDLLQECGEYVDGVYDCTVEMSGIIEALIGRWDAEAPVACAEGLDEADVEKIAREVLEVLDSVQLDPAKR